MTKLDSILKSRNITLTTKIHLIKAMVFPVVMYGCESWTLRKAEHWKFDAFELWCWRRLLRVPWTARRSSQSILKEISPECSLEGLILNTPILWPPDEKYWLWKRPWCWERLKARGEEDDREWDGWMGLLTQWTWVWVNYRSWWWKGGLVYSSPWGHKLSDMTEQLNWTELNLFCCPFSLYCLFSL